MPILAVASLKPLNDPVEVFFVLVIMLVALLLFERLQLPGIVGLILAVVFVLSRSSQKLKLRCSIYKAFRHSAKTSA